jgi:hypothetical protein
LHLRPLSDETGKNGRGRYRGRTTRLADTLILTRFHICRMITPFSHADGRTFRHRFGLNEIIETFETLDLAQFQKFSGFVRKNNGHFHPPRWPTTEPFGCRMTRRMPSFTELMLFSAEPLSSARTAILPIWQSPYLFLPLTSHSNMDSDFAVSLSYLD